MSNGTISLIIAIVMTVLSLAAIAGGIYLGRKNKTVKSVGKRIAAALLCLVLVAGVTANYACYAFSSVISTAFSTSTADPTQVAEDTAASRDLVEQIAAEGVVLLKNENRALPLDCANQKQANVNVFGWASTDPIYGGGGSGAGNEANNASFLQGLESAGFNVNQELVSFYTGLGYKRQNSTVIGVFTYDFKLYEAAREQYSEALLQSARSFSDVAIVFLSRQGGEDVDLPTDMSKWSGSADRHYLELSPAEQDMIEMVKAQGYEQVVAVINSSNAMELGFLEDEGIDAAIWIGGPGAVGFNSVGKVLSGAVNPSGRLADTYAYDVTTSPAYYNAGSFFYTNGDFKNAPLLPPGPPADASHSFVNYAEGIYVGYRYYETRWVDNTTGICDETAYRAEVQYPFGYGMSYTDFTQEITAYTSDDTTITMDVTVTNTGSVPGKDVVELYYTAPYTVGSTEKSHVVLAAFDKTETLAPGAAETLTLTLAVEDMASYDYANEKCWVLDTGTYVIKLMSNSHDVIDSRTYAVNSTVIYGEGNPRSSDQTVATNQFDDVTYGEDFTYVSRADWAGTLPTVRTKEKAASDALLALLNSTEISNDPAAAEIILKNNGLKLADLKGLSYDDPQWDLLLQQVSVEDMVQLTGMCGYITVPITSIQKPQTTQSEGPAGMNSFMNGISGVQYPSEVMLASTWNVDLAKEMGERVGDECLTNGFDGIMAPAMNIHRTPFSGRNFEYYSEDGYLSGMMGAHVVQGYNSKGVNTFIKHFALNDQESNRTTGICVWANEQSMRELYLKPFELTVKVGGTQGIMSSFNRIGATWAGASYPLLTTVLRGEWGFHGTVVSDMAVSGYQNTDQAIRAGNDMMLTPMGTFATKESTETNTGHQALRSSTHNILYTVVNSSALDVAARQSSNSWLFLLGGVDAILLAVAALGFYALTRKKKESTTERP